MIHLVRLLNVVRVLGCLALFVPLCCDSSHADEVTLELDRDRTVKGEIKSIGIDEVTVVQDGSAVVLATAEVQKILFAAQATPGGSQLIRVRLVDGSMLLANNLAITDRVATIVEAGGFEVQISIRNIDYIKFFDHQDASLAEQWDTIVKTEQRTGDFVVIKRDGNLDFLEGVVGRVDDTSVNFHMNDQAVDAAREKIEGIVYYHAAGRTLVDPVFQAITSGGSRLMIKSAEQRDNSIVLEGVSGASISIAYDQLREFDFTAHRFRFLSSMAPSTVEWSPLIFNQKIFEYQQKLNSPRFDQSFMRTELELEFPVQREFGTSYELKSFAHGIAVKGGTRMVYPIQNRFSRLSGVVGFSPHASHDGNVAIVILGDGRELMRKVLKNREDPPLSLDLPIENVGRLTLRVNYHDARNVGDIVHFCNLKVTK